MKATNDYQDTREYKYKTKKIEQSVVVSILPTHTGCFKNMCCFW